MTQLLLPQVQLFKLFILIIITDSVHFFIYKSLERILMPFAVSLVNLDVFLPSFCQGDTNYPVEGQKVY